MRFVIVGGAGFIGSHLVEHLLAEAHSVLVIDDLTTGLVENLPDHPALNLITYDILSCPLDALGDPYYSPIDGLVHLAAIPSVQASWKTPVNTHHSNLSSTVAVIKLCQALKIPRLVFASSAAVYGNHSTLPVSERHLRQPLTPYGLQKLVGEQYLKMFAKEYKFSAIALRLFNVFGPRQSPRSPYSGVISIFSSQMQENRPITIYGDGTQSRDFLYVEDAAIAFSKALQTPLKPGSFRVYNIGTQNSISLLELVESLKKLMPNWNQSTYFESVRPGDILHSKAEIFAALKYLNWSPKWSLSEGLTALIKSL